MKKMFFCLMIPFAAFCLFCSCAVQTDSVPTDSTSTVPTVLSVPVSAPTQEATEETASPEFGQTPALCETKLTVDGTLMPHSYTQEQTLYVCLGDLAQALDLAYTEQIGAEALHTCTVDLLGHTLVFTTASDTVKEDHTVYGLEAAPIFDGESWYLPVKELVQYLGFSVLEDADQNAIYCTAYPKSDSILSGKEIPVLMYHAVSDDCWGSTELFVSPAVLDAQIAALLNHGYTLITFEDFDRLDSIEKPVMLTFDDGYDDNYVYLFPILQKYQVKATVFMIVNDIGKNHKLTKEQLIEMSDSGLVSIQSHTMSHNFLSDMNEEQLDYELYQSKLVLASLTGKEPFVLCYPTGKYSNLSLEVTERYYEYGLLMSTGLYTTGGDPCMIRRYYVPRGLSAEGLLQRIG